MCGPTSAPRFSSPLAALSAFRLHNESGNIWSHLLACAACAALLARDGASLPWPLRVCLACGGACFAASVAYHAGLAYAGGAAAYGWLLAVDLAGVWAVNVGLALTTLAQAGACWPPAALAAAAALPALAAAAALAHARTPAARAAAFGLQAAARAAAPAAAAALGASHWSPADVAAHLCLELAALAGAAVNVSRWPERAAPRSLAAALAGSHTVMHVVVAAVFFANHAAALARAPAAAAAAAACAAAAV